MSLVALGSPLGSPQNARPPPSDGAESTHLLPAGTHTWLGGHGPSLSRADARTDHALGCALGATGSREHSGSGEASPLPFH